MDYLVDITITSAIDKASFLGPNSLSLSLALLNDFCDLLSNLPVKNPARPLVFAGHNFPVNELSAWTDVFSSRDAIASVPRRIER